MVHRCPGIAVLPGFSRLLLTVMQRLSFWAGFAYYFDTAVNVFLTPLPPILLALFAPA